MILAALISFAILLIAWILAPARDARAPISTGHPTLEAPDGRVASLSEAA
jgi:hypothetical protein